MSRLIALPQRLADPPTQKLPLLHLYFPQIYTLIAHQNDEAAMLQKQSILSYFLNKSQTKDCLLIRPEELEHITQRLARTAKLRVIFKAHYGAAIILRKQQEFEPIEVYLLFPKQWDFENLSKQTNDIYISNKPKSHAFIEVGKYQDYSTDLHQEVQRFSKFFAYTIKTQLAARYKQYGQRDKKNHHTPTWLLQMAKQTLKNINAGVDLQEQEQKSKANSKQKQEVKLILSKGGTLDMGKFSGISQPNTTLNIIKSYFSFLLQDDQLLQLLFLEYSLHVLLKQLDKIDDPKRNVRDHFKCLNQLISALKQCTNRQIQYREEVKNTIYKIYHELIELKPATLPQKFDKQSIQDTLKAENYSQKFEFYELIDYEKKVRGAVSLKGNLGFSSPLRTITCFNDLLQNTYQKNLWILMVEHFFFKIAEEELRNGPETIKISVKLNEVVCNGSNLSILHQVVEKYEELMSNEQKKEHLGMRLKNQAHCHIYLIKYIAAAIAFEVVKKQRRDNNSNLDAYKIPLPINNLYKQFYSLSYRARQALDAMLLYSQSRQVKESIFALDGSNKSFYKYAVVVTDQTKTISDWSKQKEKHHQNKIEKLRNQFTDFGKRYKHNLEMKALYRNQSCSCPPYEWHYRRYQRPYTCNRCNQYESYTNIVSSLQNQKFTEIVCEFPFNQSKYYGFLHNIPNDLVGMMKLVYQSQINKQQTCAFNSSQNFFNFCYGELKPYVNNIKPNPLYLYSNYTQQPNKFIKYPSVHTQFIYREHNLTLPIMGELLKPETIKHYQENYQYMIEHPHLNKLHREHEIYAKLSLKHQNQYFNQYINFGGIRVSPLLQLPFLTQKLTKRQIMFGTMIQQSTASDSYKQKYPKMLVLLNTIADINAYRQMNSDDGISQLPMIDECIQHFLNNYIEKWRFEDMYTLHIIGLVFSLFSKLIHTNDRAIQFAARALSQFQKFMKESNTGDNQIKSQYAYFLHGAMACFCEDITQKLDRQSIYTWTKLQIYYRINKVFSDQNLKNQRYRQTNLFYEQFRLKAIHQNIQNVRAYFQKYPNQLTNIVHQIDADISDATQWKLQTSKGYYVFSGISGAKVYDINLVTGILLKDGAEIAGLPDMIKKDPTYVTIFGQNRDLQIFTDPRDGSMRTRSDFSQFFPNQKEKMIMFQFQILGQKQIQIRHIIKTKIPKVRLKEQNKEIITQKQEKYTLIPLNILLNSNFLVPIIYQRQSFAWFSSQENIVVFRGKALISISNLSLLYLTKQSNQNPKITDVHEGRIIQKKHWNFDLSYLRSKQKSKQFDLLKIFHFAFNNKEAARENYLFNEGFKVLSAIQDPKYIIQVFSHVHQHERERVVHKYCLDRFKLRFTITEEGLLSDNYQGYIVRQNYNNHQLLPWLGWSKVNCLLLEKKEDELKFTNQHSHIVLIPYTNVTVNQYEINPIPQGETRQMQIFSYEIHDHLKDLRSKTRLAQMHLASIIACCYNPFFQPLMMDNQQYAIHLLRSCLLASPLSKKQIHTLQTILQNSIKQNQAVLVLLSQVIYTISKINETLPFLKQSNNQEQKQQPVFLQYLDIVQNYKFRYRKLHSDQQISKRKELTQQQLKILNLNVCESIDPYNVKRKKTKWQLQKSLKINIDEYKNTRLQSQQWLEQFNNFRNRCVPENNPHTKQTQYADLIKLQKKCMMSSEQKHQIDNSIRSYMRSKGKLNSLTLQKSDIAKLIEHFQKQYTSGQQLKRLISRAIKMSQIFNFQSYDYLSGKFKMITERDITEILSEQLKIKSFYPDIAKQEEIQFKSYLVAQLRLTVALDSIHRILLILKNSEYIDKVGLLKELQSPRKQIEQNHAWLCFQVELKTQIWLSQYQTFKLLNQNKTGSITQLNMGEGKTQVIIPMIVLDQIYNKKRKIPRVNILSPLFQEAQNNYFKFLSVTGFKINLIPIYFNRKVEIRRETLSTLQYSINTLKKKCLVMIDRDSSLSLILKIRQEQCFKNNIDVKRTLQKLNKENYNYKDVCIFRNLQILDIFDQVDALMTCVKSFVYAVGNSQGLPDSKIRFQFCKVFIEIILREMLQFLIEQKYAVIEQSLSQAKQEIRQGKFIKGLRFFKNISQQKLLYLRNRMLRIFFSEEYFQPEFQFYKNLSNQEKDLLKDYLISSDKDQTSILKCQNIPETAYNQIYIVRGILAYGVLQHCLSLRNGVQFGAPGKQNPKRVGVPYEAADVPSKRSEYSHPQVATILSYISYYNKGLTQDQFKMALKHLLNSTKSSQNRNYSLWLNCIQDTQFRPKEIKEPKQINIQSDTQIKELYKTFKNCRETIVYWLISCVYVTDLNQFPLSMTASSWDLADSKNSLGFSGTKDTHFLLPTYLTLIESPNDEINGTDGKMISLIIQNTLKIVKIKQNDDQLWKRFLQTALQSGTTCVIDAGAILAGKSLENHIVPWLSRQELFKKMKKLGISFCEQNGRWKVYDATSQTIIDRDTSIPEEQTFIIFDQARTRGADMKIKVDAVAALSLGPIMTKDSMMQAVGRLRKFGRNQKIMILSTEQSFNKINQVSSSPGEQITAQKIIEWTCDNAINENKKWLYPNSKLAWIHFGSRQKKKSSLIHQFKSQLQSMYMKSIKQETVSKLNQDALLHSQIEHKSNVMLSFCDKVQKHGSQFKVRCQDLDNVCEREIQMIEENEKQTQKQFQKLVPVPQVNEIHFFDLKVSTLNFKFTPKLQFSKNFLDCTKMSRNNNNLDPQTNNELCQINFIYIQGSQKMKVITQRQATLLLYQKKVETFGPASLSRDILHQNFITRFNDLSIQTAFIKRRGFEQALTDAQFFNGNQNYKNKELLLKTIHKNIKLVKKQDIQKLVTHFLSRRRTLNEKYQSSDIESIYKQLINSKLE